MRILIINPNTTASMTRDIAENASKFAALGTEITAMNPMSGPAAIQGPEDGEKALPGVLEIFQTEVIEKKAHDLVIIACFDDTGVIALKQISPVPVLGIGEASFMMAMCLGHQFSVVTTLSVSVPVIEDNIVAYGFKNRCARVRASEVPVLEIENDEDKAVSKIVYEMKVAQKEDACSSIILGCAGMTRIVDLVSEAVDVPVIDSVHAAITVAQSVLTYQKETR